MDIYPLFNLCLVCVTAKAKLLDFLSGVKTV